MIQLAANSSSGNSAAGVVALLFGLTIFALMYYIPTIVAVIRKVPNTGSVAVINTLLGWTLVGWVVALAMAARSAERQHVVVIDPRGGPHVLSGMIGPPPPPPASDARGPDRVGSSSPTRRSLAVLVNGRANWTPRLERAKAKGRSAEPQAPFELS